MDIKVFCPACGNEQVPAEISKECNPAEARTACKIGIKCHCGCTCVVRMYNMDVPIDM